MTLFSDLRFSFSRQPYFQFLNSDFNMQTHLSLINNYCKMLIKIRFNFTCCDLHHIYEFLYKKNQNRLTHNISRLRICRRLHKKNPKSENSVS
jgi:hypothetical protein